MGSHHSDSRVHLRTDSRCRTQLVFDQQDLVLASPRIHHRMVGQGIHQRRCVVGDFDLTRCRRRVNRNRVASGNGTVVRASPFRFLREVNRQPSRRTPHRTSRNRHRYRTEQRLPHNVGHSTGMVHNHRRSRNILCRHRVQQRVCPTATGGDIARRGVQRPRCGNVDDVQTRHVPPDSLGAIRGRIVVVRPVVRRDHRHDLHRGQWRSDLADLHS